MIHIPGTGAAVGSATVDCDQTKNALVLGTFNQQDSAVLAYLAVSCVPSEYEVYLHCSSPAAFLGSLHGCCEQVYPCTLDIADTAATQVRPEPEVRSVTTLRPTRDVPSKAHGASTESEWRRREESCKAEYSSWSPR